MPRFRGGKRSRRDRNFGITDAEFWDWWHDVKDEYGGDDLSETERAREIYEEFKEERRQRHRREIDE
jgi:hypothetical protein